MTDTTDRTDAVSRDVLIIGAGLSAIDMAYRVEEACPGLDYELLEARADLGGTWDLFRYPGVRSDSDIYTLAYPFRPWTGEGAIVDGAKLLDYIRDTAEETGIAEHIRYSIRVVSADWDSAASRWTVTCESYGETVVYSTAFLISCAGYYDYDHPHDAQFEGVEDFKGPVLHPQFWPEDLDYSDKNVVVIGSGATAITMVPSMAEKARHVTMLQRTPTYVIDQPRDDKIANIARRFLPGTVAHRLIRMKNTALQWVLVELSRLFPNQVKKLLRWGVSSATGSEEIADTHFAPPYNPWDQRLCVTPDGELFDSIRDGDASVVTGHIDRFVPEGVRLTTGDMVDADIIVTATGLKIRLLGGVDFSMDGEPLDLSTSYAWYGSMLSGIPNLAVCIGYINLSWTVRADLTARLVGRILERMRETGDSVVTPTAPESLDEGHPFMDMKSGYLTRAADTMPRATDDYPWAVRQNVVVDSWNTNRADLNNGLTWSGASVSSRS